jgi:hypothetical protein
MRAATTIEPLLGPSRVAPPIRLAFGRVFLRAFLVLFVFGEFSLWNFTRRMLKWQPFPLRLLYFVFMSFVLLCMALAFAASIALAADLIVRLIVRPLLAQWLDPRRVDASLSEPAPFHLSSSERVEGEMPARLIEGRARPAGTLVRTNLRLWFFPSAWDATPQSIRFDDLAAIQLERPRIAAWRAIRGWPDQIVLRRLAGDSLRFAVANPMQFLDWFEESHIPCFLHHD